MMGLEHIAVVIVGAIVAVVAAWFGGSQSGKKSAQAQQKEDDYDRLKKNIKARADAESDASNGSAADRLRDEFGRD